MTLARFISSEKNSWNDIFAMRVSGYSITSDTHLGCWGEMSSFPAALCYNWQIIFLFHFHTWAAEKKMINYSSWVDCFGVKSHLYLSLKLKLDRYLRNSNWIHWQFPCALFNLIILGEFIRSYDISSFIYYEFDNWTNFLQIIFICKICDW